MAQAQSMHQGQYVHSCYTVANERSLHKQSNSQIHRTKKAENNLAFRAEHTFRG